eukprot:EG_transcript_41374
MHACGHACGYPTPAHPDPMGEHPLPFTPFICMSTSSVACAMSRNGPSPGICQHASGGPAIGSALRMDQAPRRPLTIALTTPIYAQMGRPYLPAPLLWWPGLMGPPPGRYTPMMLHHVPRLCVAYVKHVKQAHSR